MDGSKNGDDAKSSQGHGGARGDTGKNEVDEDVSRSTPAHTVAVAMGSIKSPSKAVKRRKVSHACVYCRRSHMTCDLERPCARCIKRGIQHLCHDERRDGDAPKRLKTETSQASEEDTLEASSLEVVQTADNDIHAAFEQPAARMQNGNETSLTTMSMPQPTITTTLQIVQPSPVSGMQATALNSAGNQFLGYSGDWLGAQDQFQDMHNYHPEYMFNAPEAANEYNLLNDFLNNSLLDDGALLPDVFLSDNAMYPISNDPQVNGPANGRQSNTAAALALSRPASVLPADKTREYYLEAADPTGNDTPEKRMEALLTAKYDAGMLKPFNYVKGYARLSAYMDGHMSASSKQKILRQIDRFRPKFREIVQGLKDIQLIYVEMWFERTLMEYDRVFASMAIPACCWRRTGEIFRGNKEMAELIHVPVEHLRDGRIAIFEILTEESLVNYWEKFGAVAFDVNQKALLTSCSLKNPKDESKDRPIKCCFSITIRRDENKIPCLIVGNFLPKEHAPSPP